jgi:hypothetical protein
VLREHRVIGAVLAHEGIKFALGRSFSPGTSISSRPVRL